MSKFHTKEQIDSYEEIWQMLFYLKSGDHYVHVCEICHRTNDNVIIRLPGGHYVCDTCKKILRLPKENTIVGWGRAQINSKWNKFFPHLSKEHPSEPSIRERCELWKKIIRQDYMIELFNKNFEYE